MVQELHSKAEFEKAINGPHAVVFDLSDKNCPYRFVEAVFNTATTKMGVAGYRMDPKVAGIPAMINSGTFQVYHHGKMIRQEHITQVMSIGVLEQLIHWAKSQG